jgi:hypothetical protein
MRYRIERYVPPKMHMLSILQEIKTERPNPRLQRHVIKAVQECDSPCHECSQIELHRKPKAKAPLPAEFTVVGYI